MSRADSVADITREQIEKDLRRTMPTVALFQTDVSMRAVQAAPAAIPNSPSILQEGLAQLRRILMAYAVRNPELGCALRFTELRVRFTAVAVEWDTATSPHAIVCRVEYVVCDTGPNGIPCRVPATAKR